MCPLGAMRSAIFRAVKVCRCAGHDEFAAVGGFETVQNVADGDGLIFTRFLLRAKTEVLRALEAELRPVNGLASRS